MTKKVKNTKKVQKKSLIEGIRDKRTTKKTFVNKKQKIDKKEKLKISYYNKKSLAEKFRKKKSLKNELKIVDFNVKLFKNKQ